MSECVVRMEMPQNCGECRFRSDGWCYGIREFDPQPGPLDFEKRPSWCPIICQLPEGHGDLIDREYAIATACSGLIRTLPTTEGGEDWIRVGEVRESIKSAPAIVPAERSET
jgi:hypothetical protein